MTNRELLEAYRETVIDMNELSLQMERVTHSGAPRGATGTLPGAARGTNNPMAASIQLSDGISAMMARKQGELDAMAQPICTLLAGIGDPRTLFVIQNYYLMADTDADIAHALNVSRCRINQIRNRYLEQVS